MWLFRLFICIFPRFSAAGRISTDQALLDDVSSIKVRCGAACVRRALTTNVACKEVEVEQEEQEEGG